MVGGTGSNVLGKDWRQLLRRESNAANSEQEYGLSDSFENPADI